MFFSTVVTGNHYFFDGLAGVTIASTGILISLVLERRFSSAPGRSLPRLRRHEPIAAEAPASVSG
jgi:membrane-associated phospholipid phosphatase